MQNHSKKQRKACGSCSIIWTGLENINKTPNEAVEKNNAFNWTGIPLNDKSGQFDILSNLVNESWRAKSLLREKALLLQKSDVYLFWKKIKTHIEEVGKSKKKKTETFRGTGSMVQINPFREAPHQFHQESCMVGSNLSMQRSCLIETTTNCNRITKQQDLEGRFSLSQELENIDPGSWQLNIIPFHTPPVQEMAPMGAQLSQDQQLLV